MVYNEGENYNNCARLVLGKLKMYYIFEKIMD